MFEILKYMCITSPHLYELTDFLVSELIFSMEREPGVCSPMGVRSSGGRPINLTHQPWSPAWASERSVDWEVFCGHPFPILVPLKW